MFKAFRNMMKVERAPLSPEEIAFLETPPPEKPVSLFTSALSGGRFACYRVSLEFGPDDPEHSYFWATVATLAGSVEAAGWMSTLKGLLPQNRRWYIETIARKWYTLHKADFARAKAEYAESSKIYSGTKFNPEEW